MYRANLMLFLEQINIEMKNYVWIIPFGLLPRFKSIIIKREEQKIMFKKKDEIKYDLFLIIIVLKSFDSFQSLQEANNFIKENDLLKDRNLMKPLTMLLFYNAGLEKKTQKMVDFFIDFALEHGISKVKLPEINLLTAHLVLF